MSKKILLVGYETESVALAKISERLKQDSHQPKLLLGDYHNFIDNNSIREDLDESSIDNWESFSKIYEDLYTENRNINWKYLRQFESNYCYNKNINQLLRTSQIILRDHHFRRPYYKPESPSSEMVYYWLEKQLKWTERIFKEFDPDLVFTIRRNYLIKNAVAQIALSTETPIRTLVRSRLGNYHHITRNFGYGTDERIVDYIKSKHSDEALYDANEWCDKFRNQDSITSLYHATAQQGVKKEELFTTGEVIQNLVGSITGLVKRSIMRKKTKYRGALRANYFNSHYSSVTVFRSRVAYNKLKYIYTNPFEESIPDQRFIYVPLHTLPESSTLTLSTEYYESDLIRFMSKELPSGFELAVKENPNMVGLRPFSYYDEVTELPNVRLIDPTIQSKKLIQQSEGVAGISGTALLEAAVLGRPTHAFGHPEFEAVVDYHGHAEFNSFVHTCITDDQKNSDRVVKYLQFVIDNGREMSLDPINTDGKSDEFWEVVTIIEEMLRNEISALE